MSKKLSIFCFQVNGAGVDHASHDDVAQAIREGCKVTPPAEKAEEKTAERNLSNSSEDDLKQVKINATKMTTVQNNFS